MTATPFSTPASPIPVLLTPREAAQALAISERHLWSLTKAGVVPAVRLGRAVRYRPAALAHFAEQQER